MMYNCSELFSKSLKSGTIVPQYSRLDLCGPTVSYCRVKLFLSVILFILQDHHSKCFRVFNSLFLAGLLGPFMHPLIHIVRVALADMLL